MLMDKLRNSNWIEVPTVLTYIIVLQIDSLNASVWSIVEFRNVKLIGEWHHLKPKDANLLDIFLMCYACLF